MIILSEQRKRSFLEFVQSRVTLTRRNWEMYTRLFPFIEWTIRQFNRPALGPLFRKMAAVDDKEKRFSQGYIMTLNRDLDYRKDARNVVLPHTMVKRLIKNSTYRVVMDRCYCRDGKKCASYPVDFGCIFLGEGTRKLVTSGIAREVSVDEALSHLQRAADLGLVAMCLWMEMEAFGLGLNEQEHARFLEICLCCPCCCLGLQHFREMGPEVMQRFQSIGWRAGPREGCSGCGLCTSVCPVGAVEVSGTDLSVSEACLGCGLCADQCPEGAIGMDQTAPIRKGILDYFFGFRPDI